jgi:hypothetical protein
MNAAIALRFPPCAQRGEVAASYADGGVMGLTETATHDPSVAGYRATSPASPGRKVQ